MSEGVPLTDLAAMTRDVRADVERAWERLLSSNGFIGGDAVEDFEQAWASYCGVPHAVGVGSGTDALLLTLMALRIGPGDEVIVPANTFIAAAEAVVLAGATPVFADVSPDTLLLTPAHAGRGPHVPDRGGDRRPSLRPDARHGRAEPQRQAGGHRAHRGRGPGARRELARPTGPGPSGARGASASTRPSNLGAFGDAGAVVTADADLAERLRSLRDHGAAGAPGMITNGSAPTAAWTPCRPWC